MSIHGRRFVGWVSRIHVEETACAYAPKTDGSHRSTTVVQSSLSGSVPSEATNVTGRQSVNGSAAILRGMFLISCYLLAAKALSAAKEMVVAARFGVSDIVDGYQFAFTVTQWPVTFLGAAVVSTVVPLIASQSENFKGEKERVQRLFGTVLTVGAFVSVLVFIGLPVLVRNGVFPFAESQKDRIVWMMRILSLAIPASFVSKFLAGCAIAARTHLNTLFECFPAVMIIVFLSVWPSGEALVLGAFAGCWGQCILLAMSLHLVGKLPSPQFALPIKADRQVAGTCGALILAHFLLGTVDVIDQFAATTLGTGSIATLGYSNRILAIILGLVSTTICRSMFPVLSKLNGSAGNENARLVFSWLLILFVVTVLGASCLALNAEQVVQLVFERGAFTPENSVRVASALRWGAMRIPPYVLTTVLLYAITSQCRTRPVIMLGIVIFLCKLTTTALLVPMFGLPGLISSSAITYSIATLFGLNYFMANRQVAAKEILG